MDLLDTRSDTVTDVRRWCGLELAGLVGDLRNDILLVVTELVTNAYEHGGGPRQVRLTRVDTPWQILIEVDDVNARLPVVGRSRFGVVTHRGNGLVLVDNLATSWGVAHHRETGGKTVWARFTGQIHSADTGGSDGRSPHRM